MNIAVLTFGLPLLDCRSNFRYEAAPLSPMFSLSVSVCVVGFTLVGCQITPRTEPGQLADFGVLPDYSGMMKRLFDDEFGGLALGTPWNDSLAEQNALTSKRAMAAQRISICSVGTVTEGSIEQNLAAAVEFRSPGLSLVGSGQGECPTIRVPAASFSYSILRQSGSSLVGKSVVIFIRDFNEGGATNWHWHVEPDRPDIRTTVLRFRGR